MKGQSSVHVPYNFDTAGRFLRLYDMLHLFRICVSVSASVYKEVVISTSIIKESARGDRDQKFLDLDLVEPYLNVTNCKAGEK
jgi:hypothetical protein